MIHSYDTTISNKKTVIQTWTGFVTEIKESTSTEIFGRGDGRTISKIDSILTVKQEIFVELDGGKEKVFTFFNQGIKARTGNFISVISTASGDDRPLAYVSFLNHDLGSNWKLITEETICKEFSINKPTKGITFFLSVALFFFSNYLLGNFIDQFFMILVISTLISWMFYKALVTPESNRYKSTIDEFMKQFDKIVKEEAETMGKLLHDKKKEHGMA